MLNFKITWSMLWSVMFVIFGCWLTFPIQCATTYSGICFADSKLCFSATVNGDRAIMTVNTTVFPTGWVAIGLGSAMSSSNIWVMYYNNSGSVFRLTDRSSTGYRTPPLISNSTSLTLLEGPTLQNNVYTFKFSRPFAANNFELINADQTFIWGLRPNATVHDFSLGRHTQRGTFTYNVFTATTTTPPQQESSLSFDTALKWHKVTMALSWNFLAGLSIFTARYLKGILRRYWFRIHLILQLLCSALTLIGFIFIVVAHSTPHFSTSHGKLGLTVFILMWIQTVLGFIIDRLFNPSRTHIAWHDKLHWVLGYIVYILALANVFLGLVNANEPDGYIAFAAVVYGLILICFVAAEIKWGQVHEIGKTVMKN